MAEIGNMAGTHWGKLVCYEECRVIHRLQCQVSTEDVALMRRSSHPVIPEFKKQMNNCAEFWTTAVCNIWGARRSAGLWRKWWQADWDGARQQKAVLRTLEWGRSALGGLEEVPAALVTTLLICCDGAYFGSTPTSKVRFFLATCFVGCWWSSLAISRL